MTWPCGHERTPGNTQSIGRGGQVRCKTCRRVTARDSARRRRLLVDPRPYLEPEVRDAIATRQARGVSESEIARRLRL